MFDDTKVQRASALHPKFKLNCVENQVHKSLAVEQLKPAVEIENRSEKMQQDCRAAFARESHQDQPQVTAATPAKDFFACITSKRNATVPLLGQMQMLRWNHNYLSDPSTELSSLECYPNIRQVYLKLNTGLPASAAVERLLYLCGQVFSPLRSRLSNEHFEMMLFCIQLQNGETFVIAVGDGQ